MSARQRQSTERRSSALSRLHGFFSRLRSFGGTVLEGTTYWVPSTFLNAAFQLQRGDFDAFQRDAQSEQGGSDSQTAADRALSSGADVRWDHFYNRAYFSQNPGGGADTLVIHPNDEIPLALRARLDHAVRPIEGLNGHLLSFDSTSPIAQDSAFNANVEDQPRQRLRFDDDFVTDNNDLIEEPSPSSPVSQTVSESVPPVSDPPVLPIRVSTRIRRPTEAAILGQRNEDDRRERAQQNAAARQRQQDAQEHRATTEANICMLQELLSHKPMVEGEDLDRALEQQPAIISCAGQFFDFVQDLRLSKCTLCHERFWEERCEPGQQSKCADCRHDPRRNRGNQFGCTGTTPKIHRFREEYMQLFEAGKVEGETIEQCKLRARSIQTQLPRCPFNPLLDVFQSATLAEKNIISPVRLYAYIFRRDRGYSGTRGTAIAFPGQHPALLTIMRLPNMISPFILVRQQKADGTFSKNHQPEQRIRRQLLIHAFQFLKDYSPIRELFLPEFSSVLNELPQDGELPDLVTVSVPESLDRAVPNEEIAHLVRESQRSRQSQPGGDARSPSSPIVLPVGHIEVPVESPLSEAPLLAGDFIEYLDGMDVTEGVTRDEDGEMDGDEEEDGEDSEIEDALKDDDDGNQEEYVSGNHLPEAMGHVDQTPLGVFVSSEIARDYIEETMEDQLRMLEGHAPASASIEHQQPQIVEVPFVQWTDPLSLMDPRFFTLAFPDLFCDGDGVPQFPCTDPGLLQFYPVLQHEVQPGAQVAHLLMLGCRRADGRMSFPFQASTTFLAVCRQIIERIRISKHCKWIIKESENLTVPMIREMLHTEEGRSKVESLLSRCQVSTIGGPKYFKDKLNLAKEVFHQKGNGNLFVTLSFPDTHHPALLRNIGIDPGAPFAERQDAVAGMPAISSLLFLKLKDFFVKRFLVDVLDVKHYVDRAEFQMRFAIHAHLVLFSPHLDFSEAVAGAVRGRAARHQLYTRFPGRLSACGIDYGLKESGFVGGEDDKGEPKGSPDDPLKVETLDFAELVDLAIKGEAFEGIMCRAQSIMLTAWHMAAGTSAQAEEARQVLRAFAERSKEEASPEDVTSFVMRHSLEEMPLGERADRISARTMVHECREDYCFKTKAQKRARICRFKQHMPDADFLSQSHRMVLEFKGSDCVPAVKILPNRNHPDIMAFSRVMMAIWGANCDLKVIFDVEHVVHYILKYTLKKDVAKDELKKMMRLVQNADADVKCAAAVGRIAERLRNGEFTSVAKFLSACVNLTNTKREIGAPELCLILLSKPLVTFPGLKFTFVPATLDASTIDFGNMEEGGAKLTSNIWMTYSKRRQLALDREQRVLGSLSQNDLLDVSAAEFFERYYVDRDGVVQEHIDSKRVTVWPFWSDVHEHAPDNPKYYLWAKWFLLRFVPFEAPGTPPKLKDYLLSFVRLAQTYPEGNILSLDGLDHNKEDDPVVRDVIVQTFRVIVLNHPAAKTVYETKIVQHQVVSRISSAIRADTAPAGSLITSGVHNDVDRGEGGDVALEENTELDTAVEDAQSNKDIPMDLRASTKADILPVAFTRLNAAALDLLAESGRLHLERLPKKERDHDLVPVQPMVQEQQEAFDLICTDVEKGGCVFLHGGAGAGKSTVIKHLMNRFGHRLLTTGTTGKAAFLINGDTIHAVALLYKTEATLSDDDRGKLIETLAGVEMIVVDEASMMGTDMVNLLELRLRQDAPKDSTDRTRPWGGYRMVFVGDFGQCPPVCSGAPFHTHPIFNDFEVVLLRSSHRVTDERSKCLIERMRTRTVEPRHANEIRQMCCPQMNAERAKAYAEDFGIFHLVTTNAEVDEINEDYIVKFARAAGKKIGVVVPDAGKTLLFAIGARVTVLKNVKKDYGVTNGLFGTVVGALYDENENSALPPRPRCILIVPDLGGGERLLTGWDREVRRLLQDESVEIRDEATGLYRPIIEDELDSICQGLAGVVPIAEVAKCKDKDGDCALRWESSLPLRLARAVTIHKLQGTSLDKLLMTPGKKFMFGTTFTGFTRSRGGFGSIILAGNYEDKYLVDHLNRAPSPEFDLVALTQRLETLAAATRTRADTEQLYLKSASQEQSTGMNFGPSVEIRIAARTRPADDTANNSGRRGRTNLQRQGEARGGGSGRGTGRGRVQRGRGRGGGRSRTARTRA